MYSVYYALDSMHLLHSDLLHSVHYSVYYARVYTLYSVYYALDSMHLLHSVYYSVYYALVYI